MNKKNIKKYQSGIKELKFVEENDKKIYENEEMKIWSTSNLTKEGIVLEKGKYKVKMLPIVAKNTKRSEVKKENNKLIYSEYNGKDDLEYVVSSKGIKENIIIKSPRKSYKFKFLLVLENLILNEDTLELLDNETLEKKYVLSDFIMFDQNGERSRKIKYTLNKEKENQYLLTLTIDASWLNDESREFPVIIDPSIKIKEDNIVSIIVNDSTLQSDNNINGKAKVGFVNGVSTTATIEIDFKEIIDQIDILNLNRYDVFLDIKISSGVTNSLSGRYSIYDNEQLFFNDRLANKDKIRLNITDLCKRVIERIENYDINYKYNLIIKNEYTNPTGSNVASSSIIENDYIVIYSEHHLNEKNLPSLYLEYKDTESMPDSNAVKVIDHGNAGVCILDLYDGNAIHETKITSISSNRLNININHVFNFRKYQNRSVNTINSYFGNGWKSSLHQYLLNDLNSENYDNLIKYIDDKGYVHVFREEWYYERYGKKYYVSSRDVFIDYDLKQKVLVNDEKIEVKCEYINDDNLKLIRGKNINNFDYLDKQEYDYYFYVEVVGERILVRRNPDGSYLIPQYYYDDGEEENPNIWIKKALDTTDTAVYKRTYVTDYSNIRKDSSGLLWDNLGHQLTREDNSCYIVMRNGQFMANVLYKKYVVNGVNIIQNYDDQSTDISLICEKFANNSKGEIEEDIYLNDNIINLFNQKYTLEQSIKKLEFNMQYSLDNILLLLDSLNIQFDLSLRNKYLTKANSSLKDTLLTLTESLNEYNYSSSYKSVNKQLTLANTQLKQWLVEYDNYNVQYESVCGQLDRLINDQMKVVNSYIIDSDNNQLGFNGFGQLILIQDKYGNKIEVEYDESNEKILSVFSDDQKVVFNYRDDLLLNIVDNFGRVSTFEYMFDDLVTISSFDGNKYLFTYDSTYIEIINELGATLTLVHGLYGNTISSVRYSYLDESYIDNDDSKTTGEIKYYQDFAYGYNENYTIYNDENLRTFETIVSFDSQGRVVSMYDDNNDVKVFNYEDDKLVFEGQYSQCDKLYAFDSLGISKNINKNISVLEDTPYKEFHNTNIIGLAITMGNFNLSGLFKSLVINMKVTLTSDSKMYVYTKDFYEVDNRVLLLPIKLEENIVDVDVEISFSEEVNTTNIIDISLVKLKGVFYEYQDNKLSKMYNMFFLIVFIINN